MIAIARVDDVRLVSDGADGWMAIPDIKLPPTVRWRANAVPGFEAFQIHFAHEDRSVTTQWRGPYMIGGNKFFVVDAPKRVLQRLRNQLGAADVAPLVRALRAKPALRAWAKAQGFTLIRNSAGKPVGVLPPDGLTLCGHSGVDLDGDELDEAEELLDLEAA